MSGELAGRLGERVTVERRGAARDALGAAADGWAVVSECWAGLAPETGGRLTAGEAATALPVWRVTLRAPSLVAVGDRLGWRGRRLAVRRVTADPRRAARIEVMAEEER